jgi:tellurite resistance protein TerC
MILLAVLPAAGKSCEFEHATRKKTIMSEFINALPVIISLVIMEGLLSVDNAMVIAAMVSHLPEKQKVWALRAGLAGAYIFRGLTLFFVAIIIANPWIKLAGAGYLVYLMFKHLGKRDSQPGDEHKKVKQAGFWGTVIGVELADLAFSIDNVIAAVALSPKFWVVVVGVFIGIAAMRFVAGFFVNLMEKYPILSQIAYVLVGYVGIQLFVEDIFHVHVNELGKFSFIVGIIAAGFIYNASPLLQRLLSPTFRWLSNGMALVTELIHWFLAPVGALFSKVVGLFKRNRNS